MLVNLLILMFVSFGWVVSYLCMSLWFVLVVVLCGVLEIMYVLMFLFVDVMVSSLFVLMKLMNVLINWLCLRLVMLLW